MTVFSKKITSSIVVAAAITFGSTAAIAAGTITVYTAAPQQFVDEIVPVFEKKTGIEVEIIKAGSGELLNRLTAESSKPVADVLWSVDGSVIDFNPALFVAYDPKGTDKLASGMRPSSLWSPFTALVQVFIVNEGKLDGKPVPMGWKALGDPQYKGLISSARADKSGSAYMQFATVLQAFGNEKAGWSVYEKLLGNLVLSNSSGAVPRFVNDGELPIGITLEDAALRYKEGGGPVTIIYPSEGTSVISDAMALVSGAQNASDGKVFMDFILSKEAQEIVASLGRRPVRADVASNELLLPLTKIKSVPYDSSWASSERERLVDSWGELVLDVQ